MSEEVRFWCDGYSMDLLSLWPELPARIGAAAQVEMCTLGTMTFERLNHPCTWDDGSGLTAFYWTEPPKLERDEFGWTKLPQGYVTNSPLVRATWLEALRSMWFHDYGVVVDGRRISHWGEFTDDWFVLQGAMSKDRNEVAVKALKSRMLAHLIEFSRRFETVLSFRNTPNRGNVDG